MKKRSLFLLLAGMLTLASCGKKDETPPGGSVSSVSISQPSIEVKSGKRSTDVTVTLEGEGEYNKNVKLVSENEAVAKASFTEVESGGTFKVYGIAVGETKINVLSVQDETKATSLSVTVKAKEEAPGVSEILSVSLSKETHLFHESDSPLEVTASLNGRGTFDDTMVVALSANPAVSVNKTEVKDGDKLVITPTSLSSGENTTIHVSSKQDETKYAELVVRVDEDLEPETPENELKLNHYAHNFILKGEGETQEKFKVIATTEGTVTWSWKDSDATEYVEFVETPTGNSVEVIPLKATEEGRKITLVAKVGDLKKECKFTVTEQPSEFRTYYLSNNSYLNYGTVYFYTWKGEDESKVENAPWPGVKLEEVIKNTLNEDCYVFYADIIKYDACIFSDGNGNQTPDVYYSAFGAFNNVWFDGEGAHFTQIAKDVPTVSFYTNSVSIYNGEDATTFGFDVRKGDAVYQVTSGADKIDVTAFSNGSISIEGKALGNAAIKVYIPGENEGEVLAEDYLYVEVLDLSTVTTFYFTNNKDWDNVYVYAWKGTSESADEEYAPWPGVQLVNPLKNTSDQDVYLVHLPLKYNMLVMNCGNDTGKTTNIDLKYALLDETHDNMYPSSELNPYNVSYAKFEEFPYSVSFADASVDVYSNKNAKVKVSAFGKGVIYNISEGSDVVALHETSDSHVTLKYLKNGTATIRAFLHGATAELSVTCKSGDSPVVDTKLYYTNLYNWSEVYVYAWNDTSSNGWPGVKLETKALNTSSEEVYELDIDESIYDNIIINSGAGAQTVDISLDNPAFATNNNIYPSGSADDSGHLQVGYATFAAATATVECTFTCEYNTEGNGDLYIVLIKDPYPQVWYKMTWTSGNIWTLTHEFAVGANISFKVVVGRSSGDVWEGGDNRPWTIPSTPTTYECHWQS